MPRKATGRPRRPAEVRTVRLLCHDCNAFHDVALQLLECWDYCDGCSRKRSEETRRILAACGIQI